MAAIHQAVVGMRARPYSPTRFTLRQAARAVRERWIFVTTCTLAAFFGGSYVAMHQPMQYVAEAQLLFDLRSDPALGALGTVAGLTTQIELLKSEKVAARALALLAESGESAVATQQLHSIDLLKSVNIEPLRGSSIIEIAFTAESPAFAARAANAFAQAATETSIELRLGPARESAQSVAAQLKVARSELAAAQDQLSQYQQDNQIVATDDKMDQEVTRLNALEAQLVAAESGRTVVSAGAATSSSGEELDLRALKAQLATLEARSVEQEQILGASHPSIRQLRAQLAAMREQVAEKEVRVVARQASGRQVGALQVSSIRTLVESQKEAVMRMKAKRDEMSLLQKDLQTAQRNYDVLSQKSSQLALEARNEAPTVRILAPAVEPAAATKRRVLATVLGALFGGALLGAGLALLSELRNRRVRAPDDVEIFAGVPVLGTVQRQTMKWTPS